MPDFTTIHASGKWSLLGLLTGGLAGDMPDYKRMASIVVITEANHLNGTQVAKIAAGWGWFRSPLSDCVIFWNPVTWKPTGAGRAELLTELQYFQGSGALFPRFHAIVQPLKHVATTADVTVIAAHMPLRNSDKKPYTKVVKGVERKMAGRMQVSNDALAGMTRLINSIDGHRIVSCDWNIPERTAVGRLLLARVSTPAKLTRAWVGHIDKADEKRSLIDGVMTDLPVRESTLMGRVKSSDHQPVRVDLTIPALVTPTPAPVTPVENTVATSQNGYTANDASLIVSTLIPGTTRKVNLRKGAPGQLLAHFAGWFDKNIETVDGGILDDWGYANRPIRGQSTGLSNHASGTALDLNAPRHPLGKSGTFTAAQTAKIRAQLKQYEGAIRWGGDYSGRKDEMHFEIHADVATCERVLAKVTSTPARETDPNPIPAKEAGMNNVQYGRKLIAAGLTEIGKAKGRRVVAIQAAVIRTALAAMPKA